VAAHQLHWLDHIRRQARAYGALVVIAIGLLAVARQCKPDTPLQLTLYSVAAGVFALLLFLLLLSSDVRWIDHVKHRWKWYLVLLTIGITLLLIARSVKSGPATQPVLYSLAAGTFGLLLFQSLTDFNNARSVAEILDHYQLSFHVGARLYESHHGIPSRADAVEQFVKSGDVIRLLTSTADNYLLSNGDAYHKVIEKLANGATMQILLFTPIYSLRPISTCQTRLSEAKLTTSV